MAKDKQNAVEKKAGVFSLSHPQRDKGSTYPRNTHVHTICDACPLVNPTNDVTVGGQNTTSSDLNTDVHTIVIDCSHFNFLDIMAVEALSQIYQDYKAVGIKLWFCGLDGKLGFEGCCVPFAQRKQNVLLRVCTNKFGYVGILEKHAKIECFS
ncbi:MAG: sodium-independent anion transporter [Candidatus Omnitrophica bacterium]|nr:sodium-independent anion transporter [Candidatus Omnitrophota bacterium]